jgi:hypothetical protein
LLSLFNRHISGAQYQGLLRFLVNEKHGQLSACVAPSQSEINVFILSLTFLNEAYFRLVIKGFFHLGRFDMMFESELIYDIPQPNCARDLHCAFSHSPSQDLF